MALDKLDDLKEFPRNPRDISEDSIGALKLSLSRFGDIAGITWNERTGHLVSGHQRVRSLREEHGPGLEIKAGEIVTPEGDRFPVRVVDWDADMEKAANIAANNPMLSGEYSTPLDELLDELRVDAPELIDGMRTDELLESLGLDDKPEITEDEVPAVPADPVTKPGDVWMLGDHRLVCGDSTDETTVRKLTGEHQAQMIFTDPPYGVGYDGGAKKRDKLAGDEIGTDIYAEVLPHLKFAADDKAALYLWYADGHAAAAAAAAAAAGYVITAQIIWAKNHAQFVTSAHYKGKHEPCYYAHRKGKSARWYGPNNEVTLWEYDRSARNDYHPTQKPVPIAARAITNSSAPGDIVLDLFLGGGTTLIAAEQLDRRCFGIELDPAYCDVIVERWENLTGGKATRG